MVITILKTIFAAVIISFVSWLSNKNTQLAGFLTALPLTTLLALLFGQVQWQDSVSSVKFAQSIFYAVPLSLLFFVPFLLANKLKLNFWTCYISGLVLLALGYIIHTKIIKTIV